MPGGSPHTSTPDWALSTRTKRHQPNWQAKVQPQKLLYYLSLRSRLSAKYQPIQALALCWT